MALKKITGKDIKEAVDWLWEHKQDGGCVHQVLGTTDDGTKLCFVVGWANGRDYGDDDKKYGYFDEGYCISAKIGYQHRNNAMQTDYDWDFNMPYDLETGDVWDTSSYVPRDADWEREAADYNKEAQKIWNAYCIPNEEGTAPIDLMESKKKEAKKHTCSMQKKKESLAKKKEANSEEYITDWQADIIKGLEKVKDKYGLVIEYNGPFSDEWKEYPTYSVFVLKGGKKEDIGTVGTDYVHAFVDYTSPGMNVSSPHYAKDYSAEEAIQAILNSAKMCLGKKGEAKKNEGAGDTIKVTAENVMLTVNDVYVDEHGGSFSVETPEEGKSYNLLDMQEMIRGMCEDCTGYADYSRDGSELFIKVMAGEMDDNGEWTGDYYTAYSFRCIARILSYSLEGIIDFLDESN